MSGYEEEHNIPRTAESTEDEPRRRPDMTSFFAALDLTDTSGADGRSHNNTNADPIPANITAVFRQLANSFQVLQGETEGVAFEDGRFVRAEGGTNELLSSLIQDLMSRANDPPRRVQGMPDSFFDELERVPKKQLKEDQCCPICSNPFLEDKYPLVVRLPCHKDHIFDMECIRPWLKLNTTCPMDRKDLQKKKEPPKALPKDDDEEEYDDMYA